MLSDTIRPQAQVITLNAGREIIATAQLESLATYERRKHEQQQRDEHNQRIIEKLANGELVRQ